MGETRNQLVSSYISDLQIQILNAGYAHCKPDWGWINIRPKYNKIYFICEGEGWIKIGDTNFYPKPGEIFFIPADTLHSFSTISENTYTKYWCHFTSNIAFAPLFQYFKLPFFANAENSDELKSAFKKLVSSYKSVSASSKVRSKAAVLEIISCVIDLFLSDGTEYVTPLSLRRLQNIIHYIDDHLSKDLTIEELSQIMHFHPNYFIKYFKSHLGLSPIQYINKRRLEKAKYLISNTDMTLGEVAHSSGFSDLSHFSKSFKKHTGVTPKKFRGAPH